MDIYSYNWNICPSCTPWVEQELFFKKRKKKAVLRNKRELEAPNYGIIYAFALLPLHILGFISNRYEIKESKSLRHSGKEESLVT